MPGEAPHSYCLTKKSFRFSSATHLPVKTPKIVVEHRESISVTTFLMTANRAFVGRQCFVESTLLLKDDPEVIAGACEQTKIINTFVVVLSGSQNESSPRLGLHPVTKSRRVQF